MTTNSNQKLAAPPFWRRAANILYRASRTSLHVLYICLTLLVSLILMASAFSDMVSPTVWIVAAYLGLFFPVIILGALFWLLFMMITRRWHAVLVLLVTFLICGVKIWRYCPLHISNPDPIVNVLVEGDKEGTTPVDTFRVMTFNSHTLGEAKVNRSDAKIPVMDMVRDCQADVVMIQEYQIGTTKDGFSEAKLHNLVRKQYPYTHFHLNYGSKNNLGMAIFSRWPIRVKEEIDLGGKGGYKAGYYELDVHGRRVSMVNFHLQTNSISKENRELYNKQVHNFQVDSLSRMEEGMRQLSPSFRNRTVQVASLNRFLSERRKKDNSEKPFIMCGDMNDTPASFAYRSLRGNLYDTWEDAGFGPGITFRKAPFWFRIDHIFHSRHFHTLDVRVVKEEENSDHYPVMATFQLLPVGE